MAKDKTAVEDFISKNSVNTLAAVIDCSSAIFTDFVNGRRSEKDTDAMNKHLEGGPARMIGYAIEQAAKVGGALRPIIGFEAERQLTEGSQSPVLEGESHEI